MLLSYRDQLNGLYVGPFVLAAVVVDVVHVWQLPALKHSIGHIALKIIRKCKLYGE